MTPNKLKTDDYFLSATNPLATADQKDLEERAIAWLDTPQYDRLRAAAARRWRELAGSSPTAEAWSRFESLIDECAFAAILKALNGDPARPKVLRVVMPPHDWFGMSVPGSRFAGGPGSDQSYAIIPVDFGTRYRIKGQWIGEPPADHNYTLSPNAYFMNSIATYHHNDLVVEQDGSFTLTVGPEKGGKNHIQTMPGAEFLFIRDCRSDWRQAATALTVEALDPPRTAPWDEEQLFTRALQIALDDAPSMYYWVRLYQNMEANTLIPPALTDNVGGLVAQTTSFARIVLEDDEAFVIRTDPAGAKLHDLQLNDYWFYSVGDYYGRTASFNNQQTALEPDGTATYVVSLKDPGVHNWLDPNGLHETLFVARWQRLPTTAQERKPSISGKIVKMADLDKVLPSEVVRVTPQQRREQLEDRLATYQLRLIDS
ncbi:MAG: hypothetical protein WDA24_11035 [Tissierellales bacterium]